MCNTQPAKKPGDVATVVGEGGPTSRPDAVRDREAGTQAEQRRTLLGGNTVRTASLEKKTLLG